MNQEKINDLLHKVMDIKHDTQQVLDEISSMDSAYEEQTGREQALEEQNDHLHKEVTRLEDKNQGLYDDKAMLEKNVKYLRDENERFKREVADLKERLKMEISALERLRKDTPTMPVIPKDVAIAIFREGIKEGVCNVCDGIDNYETIEVEESGYTGGFEVSFSKCVDLADHIDTDWMRGKVGNYEELNVINALMGLCEAKEFECRIHGIDENK